MEWDLARLLEITEEQACTGLLLNLPVRIPGWPRNLPEGAAGP